MFDQLKARFLALPQAARIALPILAAVIVLCAVPSLCCATLNAGSPPAHVTSSSTSAPGGSTGSTSTATKAPAKSTATPKPAPSVLKLSGNGSKQSPTFHVNGQWKITFHCDNSTSLQTVPFYILVYNSDGSSTFDSVSFDCPKGGASDESVIHAGGDKYLDVSAMSPWSLEVVDIP